MRDLIALYRELLEVYPPGARRFLHRYAAWLGVLAIFDAAALGLLAIVVGPVATGNPVSLPFIGEIGDTGVLVAMAFIVLLVLAKGAASTWALYWATRQSAKYELELGMRLFSSSMRVKARFLRRDEEEESGGGGGEEDLEEWRTGTTLEG